jgi:hypothetical protein
MKKIIAAFDGLKFSGSTCEYAIYMAQQTGAHLVGVFLEDFTYNSYKIHELVYAKGGVIGAAKRKLDKIDTKTRGAAVGRFEDRCHEAGIEYSIHRDHNVAIKEMLHESIFADLVIIDSSETLSHHQEHIPTEFIRDLLVHVQCPVLIVPHHFNPIEQLVILYDGEPCSVHATKMFSYSLSALKRFPTEVVSVNPARASLHVPDNKLMKEYMKRHFPSAGYTILRGLPETEITGYLKKQGAGSLIILGAYQRGMISRWLRASLADALMKDVKVPLFIAHNK